ncbi:unnamed protein product [Miscanthus lutarioriparius]|uniref:GAG-pre-integrase domain-containing protein n=1 Tax=Miscanthus lutarioriparius TaxID=422564 RepID=A0A811RSP5_9POAL|nr:unnamed protein product [Miscanthus lutarioriparius]
MASMKFDLPLLDYKARFALWQVKMWVILAQFSDLDEALDGFGGKGSFANFRDTIILSRDELTLAEVYEALQTREKMKGMVQSDVSSSKGEVLQLYVLRGSTLHGFVTAAAVSNDEPSKTNLWHMRLGHMSELGMAELIKRDLLDSCTVGKMKFYEHCVFGKHKRVKFNVSVHITKVKGYELWNPETKKTFMSRSVVFNEYVMFNDSLSTDVSPVGSDEEQQHVSVQVEHVDDQETEIVDNNAYDIVQHSPTVLQPQNQSITDRRTKRNCGPRPCLIEECDMVHYAFSCAEQVENIHEPATYTEAIVSGDREKWISAMQEEMQSLEKNGTWDVVRLPKQKKAIQWIFRYLRGVTNACLKFGRTEKGLYGYVDLDFTVDLDKRRSLTGYVFTVGGCAVSWRATLQPVVALSTIET